MSIKISKYTLGFFLLISSVFYGQENIYVTPELFKDVSSVQLYGDWKYYHGDNINWAEQNIDTSSWQNTNPGILPNSKISKEWQGVGWFMTTFRIDTAFFNKPFLVSFHCAGKIKFYYNGKLVLNLDINSKSDSIFSPSVTITFDSKNEQTFLVRYSNNSLEKYNNAGYMAGFAVYLGPVDKVRGDTNRYIVSIKSYQMFFLGITLAFCLLHLILFIYHREVKSNLYFAIYLFVHALGTYFDYAHTIQSNVFDFLINIRLHRLFVAISIVVVLRLIYSIVNEKITIKFWLFVAVVLIAGTLAYQKPNDNFIYLEIANLIAIAEIIRLFTKALKRGSTNIWLIVTGFIIVLVFSFYDLFMDFGWISPIYNINNGYPFGLIGLFVCISIYLAKDISDRNQLIIEQEKIVKEKEVQEKFLLRENEKKRNELEEARKIQISMLPSFTNNFPEYDIYFDMRTATEVGGDYYDYNYNKDVLDIVIGDATGHGAKAGLMVATFKSLFSALGEDVSITHFFDRCNEIIKSMKLGNLFMAMSFVRLNNKHLEFSNAGMPPALIYRKKTNSIEELVIKSMPLGSPIGIPYSLEKRDLEKDDILILLSDGLEETFNEEKEMLGMLKIKETLVSNANLKANEIAVNLFTLGNEWRKKTWQRDDITIVVIKAK